MYVLMYTAFRVTGFTYVHHTLQVLETELAAHEAAVVTIGKEPRELVTMPNIQSMSGMQHCSHRGGS